MKTQNFCIFLKIICVFKYYLSFFQLVWDFPKIFLFLLFFLTFIYLLYLILDYFILYFFYISKLFIHLNNNFLSSFLYFLKRLYLIIFYHIFDDQYFETMYLQEIPTEFFHAIMLEIHLCQTRFRQVLYRIFFIY